MYEVGDSEPLATVITYSGSNSSENFNFQVSNLAIGDYILKIYAEDTSNNSALATEYPFEVAGPPSCILENLATPTTDTTPTYTGTCTDLNGVVALYYRFYDVLEGDFFVPSPNYPTITEFSVGSLGSNSISFSFTPSTPLPDGAYIVEVLAQNTPGFTIASGDRAQDYLTVEAEDNRPPTLIFNEILPESTSDTRPYITGACRDTYDFETNSTISSIEYRLDSSNPGDWVSMPAFDGAYNSANESFSIRLPELSLASHTLSVRCEDSSGNNTDDDSTTETQIFAVVAPSEVPAELVSFEEDFSTQLRNSIFFTDAIWGNGIVRLKETLGFTTTEIDTNNFAPRYGSLTNISDYDVVKGTANLIWYVKQNEFVSFDTQTQVMVVYPGSTYNMSQISTIEQTLSSTGDVLVWIAGRSGLSLFNVTDNVHIFYSANGFASGDYQPNRIALDTRDGRMAAYIRNNTTNDGQGTNLLYLDTGSDFTNTGDDAVTWITSTEGIDLETVGHIEFDQDRDLLHMALYNTGLATLHDNNTPTNLGDDTRSTFAVAGKTQNITDIALDTTSHTVFFTNSTTLYKVLYAVVFDSESSITLADAEKYDMANSSDLYNYSLSKVTFLEGPQYVGNQLFLSTSEGAILYYSTNGSYNDSLDDTVIVLNTAGYLYPAAATNVVVADYNTIYTVIDRLGLLKVDLDRSWESQNTAVGISAPSENKLYVNNITLDELDVVARIDDQGNVAPDSVAAVVSSISVDDGLTWEEIEVGEQKAIDSEDYRVRFKLDLSTNPGTTAIVDTYSLSFGAYTEAPTEPTLTLTPSLSTVDPGQSFNLTIKAADDLGFPITSYAEAVTLSLYDANTDTVTTGLNTTEATLADGTVSITGLQINKGGSFYIRANDGTRQANSTVITVAQDSSSSPSDSDNDPVPTLSFSASKYEAVANEKITLNWSTTNLTSVSLDNGHGTQSLNGSIDVSPDNSRTYTLTGTGQYGGLQSSLYIKVTPGSASSTDGSSTTTVSSEDSTTGIGGASLDSEDLQSESGAVIRITSPTQRNQTVLPQSVVRIQWNISGDPDRVYIDYLDQDVSSSGSFDFVASETKDITISAYKDGELLDSEVFSIVIDEATQVEPKSLITRLIELLGNNIPIVMVSTTGGISLFAVYRLLFRVR